MFIKINLFKVGDKAKGSPRTMNEYIVDDTDFNETVFATDLLDAFRKVYENKGVNIPPNLIKFIRWWEKHFDKDFFGFGIGGYCKDWEPYISKYKEELDKYLMLV